MSETAELLVVNIVSEGNVRLFAEADEALVESVKDQGILQSLKVYSRNDDTFGLIDGNRRLDAAKKAGLEYVPCLIVPRPSSDGLITQQLVLNGLREGLNPMEEAKAFSELLTLGRTQAQIAASVGKSPGYVSESLSLLKLTAEAQQAVMDGKLTVSNAHELARLDEAMQDEMLRSACSAPFRRVKTMVAQALELERTKVQPAIAETEIEEPEVNPMLAMAEEALRAAEVQLLVAQDIMAALELSELLALQGLAGRVQKASDGVAKIIVGR